jgi:hypothetical protein
MAGNPTYKAAVYIVTVPEDWKPQRPHDYPNGFTSGELHVKNVSGSAAVGAAFVFNKRQMAAGLPDRRWAIATRWVDIKRNNKKNDAIRRHLRETVSTPEAVEAKGGAV